MPEINLPASIESIQKATDFLRAHIDEKRSVILPYVELAVEELIVNVAQYAYPESKEKKDSEKTLNIGCRWVNMDGEDLFCVWLRDWGIPFDPFRSVATPNTDLNIEERQIGGLGVHFVKHLSSHYIYSDSEGSNTIELYFSIKEA